jgi:hypothetical protein
MGKLGPGLFAWSCLAGSLFAQITALVPSPATVRAAMSDSSGVVSQLQGGEHVEIAISLTSENGCWTSVRVNSHTGYLRCEQLRKESATASKSTLATPQQAAIIDTLLELSGTRSQIAQLTDQRQFRSIFAGIGDADQAQRLQGIFAGAFRPDAFYGPLRARLNQYLTPARTPILLQWLSTPLSRRVVELESKASSPQARADLERFAGSVQNEPPPQTRMNLVQRLDSARRSSEFRVEIAMVLIRNVHQALGSGGSTRESDAAIDRLRSEMWRTARDGTLLHFLYTYRGLSDAELEEYVRFWESDDGRWFTPILHEGFLDAIRSVTDDLLARLRRLG